MEQCTCSDQETKPLSLETCRHWDSPPGNVGLHQLHHGDGGLVDFDKGATEDLSEPQRVNDFHHFRTDAFDPVKRPSCF